MHCLAEGSVLRTRHSTVQSKQVPGMIVLECRGRLVSEQNIASAHLQDQDADSQDAADAGPDAVLAGHALRAQDEVDDCQEDLHRRGLRAPIKCHQRALCFVTCQARLQLYML